MRLATAVLMLALGGVAAGCGDGGSSTTLDGSGGTTATGAASSGGEASHAGPLDAPDCSTAVALVTVGAGTSAMTVKETADGQWLCLPDRPIGLDSSPGQTRAPALTDSGSLRDGGVFYLYVLPADTPAGVTVRDETGAVVPVAQARDGDHLVILDVDADAQLMGGGDVERTWQVLGPDGAVLLTLTGRGPPPGSAPATYNEVLGCLAGQGISPTDQQPFSPEVAGAAWSACADLDRRAMAASGMPAAEVERLSAFVRCMADQGWLQVILHGSSIDVAAHNAASARCESP